MFVCMFVCMYIMCVCMYVCMYVCVMYKMVAMLEKNSILAAPIFLTDSSCDNIISR